MVTWIQAYQPKTRPRGPHAGVPPAVGICVPVNSANVVRLHEAVPMIEIGDHLAGQENINGGRAQIAHKISSIEQNQNRWKEEDPKYCGWEEGRSHI